MLDAVTWVNWNISNIYLRQRLQYSGITTSKFCSTFAHFWYKLPRWVSFCPDGVSFWPEYHPQSVFFTQQSHTPLGDMSVHKTNPGPPQNCPFPGLNLKVGKMNYHLGNLDPKWKKCLKSGQHFSRSGPKKKYSCSPIFAAFLILFSGSGSVC